ncbi:MAG TPA: class I SAM-dependent methyltransferase [Gammaproteobacteria bacterium]|nr:class I SAM-dependent methyltransferase [Gammaproteobacteria bacterium]
MADLFNEKADTWDVNDRVKQLSSAIGSAILQHVALDEQMNVMDFGAGTGLISAHVAPRVKKIVAVDVSRAMLDKLAAKPELHGKIQVLCQDIIEQPIDERFDLIMSAMAMHHVQDTDKMLARFAEHLKPGGRIALADLDEEDGSFHAEGTEGIFHTGFARNVFKTQLEKHGFEKVRFVTAHTVVGDEKDFPVFLALGVKGQRVEAQALPPAGLTFP